MLDVAPNNRCRGPVMRGLFGAASAGRYCAPAVLITRIWAALQLDR
jgi:hypothetical protein